MTASSPPDVLVRNIAIATDFSPWSDRATQHALLVARQFGAAVHFVHAVRRSEFAFVPDMMVELEALAQRDCDDLRHRLNEAHSLDSIETRYWNLDGEVSEVFGEFIHDHSIDLLVLGTRGKSGISKFLSGSIAQEIFRYVSCPILTVGPLSRRASRQQLDLNRVLFATDLSKTSSAAFPYVMTAAKIWNADIDVLHVCSSEFSGGPRLMEEFANAIEQTAKLEGCPSIHCHLIPGKPSRAVLDFAKQNGHNLIVLGLDPHRSLYGGPSLSHAYEIVCQAACPVLSVSCSATAASSCRSEDAGYSPVRYI